MQTSMNKSELTDLRKELRNHSTPAEATLWRLLKSSQISHLKFRRQHSVGPYIIDFYCPKLKNWMVKFIIGSKIMMRNVRCSLIR